MTNLFCFSKISKEANAEPQKEPDDLFSIPLSSLNLRTVESLDVLMNLHDSVDLSNTEEPKKTKKVRKRKKSQKNKNEVEENLDVVDNVQEQLKIYESVKTPEKQLKDQREDRSKHKEPFFANNRKGARYVILHL